MNNLLKALRISGTGPKTAAGHADVGAKSGFKPFAGA